MSDDEFEYSDDDYEDYYEGLYDDNFDQLDNDDSNEENFEYICMKVTDVYILFNQTAEHLSQVIQLTPSLTKILLHTLNWNHSEIVSQYIQNRNKLLADHRIIPIACPQVDNSTFFKSNNICTIQKEISEECPVCLSEITTDAVSLSCGHKFCKDCWINHFEIQISQGVTINITCMASKCQIIAPEDFVLPLLKNPNLMEKYHKFSFSDYVQSHPQLQFCPGLNCTIVVHAKENKAEKVTCRDCKTIFCFQCGGDFHFPTDCDTMKKWYTKCVLDSGIAKYIKDNTKDCPNCYACIEKNGGCNHMKCYSCKHDFCWLCLQSWQAHSAQTYVCSRYKENPNIAPKTPVSTTRETLEKYRHYYQRWENHNKSLKLEKETLENIRQHIQKKLLDGTSSWVDWQYLLDAASILAQCRYTLQYTYPFAYYLEPGSQKDLFEYQQAQLEAEIENLSWNIEHAEMTDRGELQNQMDIVEKRRCNLLMDLQIV